MTIPTKHALVIPDCHVPYLDRRAYEIMLAVGQDLNPDEVVILGDYADFYAVNSHGKAADRVHVKLQDEVAAVNTHLDELDKLFPEAKRVFIEGNHCYRLERYLNTRAPELFGTITVPQLFKLSQRGWHWVPYGPKQLYQIAESRLFARHEPLTTGVNHARGTVVKAGCSLIYGHVHTIQSAQVVMANGDQHRGICPGWLGDETHPEFSYVKSHHQWSLGFEVVTILSTGVFFSQTVHIIKCSDGKYRAEWNGTIYEN